MNDPNFLAPPQSAMSGSSTLDANAGSGQSSPDSSRSKSPLVSFDIPLDPSDPLSFLMDSHSGDSSAEDSYVATNTPPSSHDSPAAEWSGAVEAKEGGVEWPETQFAYPFGGFNPASVNMMDSDPTSLKMPSQLDTSYLINETLALWLDPSGAVNAPADMSSFPFSFDPNAFGDLNMSLSADSSGSSSVASSSSSPSMEQAHAVTAQPAASLGTVTPSTPAGAVPTVTPAAQTQNMVMPTGEPLLSGNQAIDELTQRAKQTAGVTVALPIGMDTSDSANGQAPKLPIPRLQRPVTSPSSSTNRRKSSAASSQPSAPSPPSQSESSGSPPPPAPTRTKTSHTTIERRYRTNLNARIQSLRAAVPALRVLETKSGNRVGNLSIKAGTRRAGIDVEPGADEEDVIDERGYIDGVKVARKGSKANVLGKATEYIRVLKRREHRLKREQEGLKTLIRSLVGGPALLKEWEVMWRERFGGPEKDEVDAEDGEADDENDDDDENEDGEDDLEEDGAGKKRKRAKVEGATTGKGKKPVATAPPIQPQPQPATQAHPFMMVSSLGTATSSPVVQPEKRKRGRPRKNPIPQVAQPMVSGNLQEAFPAMQQQQQPVHSANVRMEVDHAPSVQGILATQAQSASAQSQQQQPQVIVQQQPQPGQYLLAAFAFFSFFNGPPSFHRPSSWGSPTAHGHHEHAHSGTVLGSHHDTELAKSIGSAGNASVFTWHNLAQALHVIASLLLLLSIITPWLPRVLQGRISRAVPRALKPLLGGVFVSHSGSRTGRSARAASPSTSRERSSDDENASEEEKADSAARSILLAALRDGRFARPAQEKQMLREALGLGTGFFGLTMSVSRFFGSSKRSRSRFNLERRMLEQKAALRLAELVALDARTPMPDRLQIYLFAFKFLSTFTASASDLATLALVVQPFWHSKATSLWALALKRAQGKGSLRPQVSKAYETFVLESMSVEDAAKEIAKLDYINTVAPHRPPQEDSEGDTDGSGDEEATRQVSTPLAVLASHIIRSYVRDRAERLFLQSVSGEIVIGEQGPQDGDRRDAEVELARIVDAGRSLDFRTSYLVELFDRVCNPASYHLSHPSSIQDLCESDEEDNAQREDETDQISALLHSILLYRQIFPSTLLSVPSHSDDGCKASSTSMPSLPPSISISLTPMPSPPPSPSRQSAALHLLLRRHLYSPAFDRLDELEDARDRVVDMLTSESARWPKRLQY